MHALSIVGNKKTGKTTLAVELCRELKSRGLKVAAAKFSHHEFDRPNTDTSKLTQVCDAVVGISETETALFWPKKQHLPDLIPLLQAEVLIVEGGRTQTWLPRVLLLNEPDEAPELGEDLALATFGEVSVRDLPHFTEVTKLADLVMDKGFSLPGLDCGACGLKSCLALSSRIVAGKALPAACRARETRLKVVIGGEVVPMNNFVEKIVAGSILGMLSQLKGYMPGRIEISLES